MSPRTLQRHLKERGTDFKNLVDDTRRRFALTYLKDRRNSLTEIAFLLGYSDASAFNRAFKRWTGLTPLAYRAPSSERHRAGGGRVRSVIGSIARTIQTQSLTSFALVYHR